MICNTNDKLQPSYQLSQHHPLLHTLITSGQGTWIFGADSFCQQGTKDVVATPSALLNSIVDHLQQAILSKYKYSNHLSSFLHFQHSFSYPLGQYQYKTNLSHKASLEVRDCWKNYQKKTIQWLYRRDLVIFKTAPGPRFLSALSFLPKYKSNW